MQAALCGDRIAVVLDGAREKTKGGIILADDAKEETTVGTVVGVGPGVFDIDHSRHVTPSVKVGDRILFGRFSGSGFDGAIFGHEAELVTIISEPEVIAILSRE